jgi:hypothetical protein
VEVVKVVEVPVPQEKIVRIETVKEIPYEVIKYKAVDRIVEKPIEVIRTEVVEKIIEKIVEVEKIVTVEKEEDCDCFTGVRFIDTWNKLFKISGNVTNDCLTEKQFISMVSDSFNANAAICMRSAEAAYPEKREVNPFTQIFDEAYDSNTMMTTGNDKFNLPLK